MTEPDRPDGDGLRAKLIEFDSYLNEPPAFEDKMKIRDYRHQAYAKWSPLLSGILSLLRSTPQSSDGAEGTALARENHWRKLEGRDPAPPQPAPKSWPQDAPPLRTELFGPDGMGSPSEADLRKALDANRPAPDAMREALAVVAGLLDQFGGYSGVPACDSAITLMQQHGLDRWSMQSQIERSSINANVPQSTRHVGGQR